jgi:WD40 repeat protein
VAPSLPGEIRRFEGHLKDVLSVALSPDSRRALSGSADGTMRIWDVETGRLLHFSPAHGSWVTSVAFSPRGAYAMSGGLDGKVRVWEMQSGKEIRCLTAAKFSITSIAFSPDGRYVLASSEDEPFIRLWEIESGREVRRFEGHTAAVCRAAISPNGQRVVSLSQDCTLRWWDLASGRELRWIALASTYDGPLASAAAIAPDSRHAVSCNLCAEVDLWDLETGQRIREFVGHNSNVFGVAFSPDGRWLVSCGGTDYVDADLRGPLGHDNTIRVWDVESGAEVACLMGHTGNVNSVAVSSDSRYVLSGSNDRTVRLWSMPTPS